MNITSQKINQSQISENRRLLLLVIETIILCGRPWSYIKRSSRFHPNNSEPFNHTAGNFIELPHFFVKASNKTLKDHLKYHQKNASYISNTSQNEMIKRCRYVITDNIIEKIKESIYFSISYS